MTPQEAALLLNGITFRPGWAITARHTSWLHHEIDLLVTLSTVETSCITQDGQYLQPKVITVRRVLRVEPEDNHLVILRRFLDAAHELDWHEDREFLRIYVDGRWVAPFHPHTGDGDENWLSVQLERAVRPTAR